jgi:putative membrane protein
VPSNIDLEPPARRFDESGDATRRTRLATERTYLAWWRTGLTALAVSLGIGKLVPALSKGSDWPYVVVGAGYAILGLGFIGYGFHRQREVDEAVARGEYARPLDAVLFAITAFGAALALATLALLFYEA